MPLRPSNLCVLLAAILLQLLSSPQHLGWACLNQLYHDEGETTMTVSDARSSADAAQQAGGSQQSAQQTGGGLVAYVSEEQVKVPTKGRKICYPDGVCFSNNQAPYVGLPLPIPPVGMPLRYYLYTPDSSIVEDLPVTGESVNYLDDRPLKLFVHGFGMNSAHVLVIEFARKMVYQCECNVIVVDWRGGSYGGYTSGISSANFRSRSWRAFSNSRVAARILGKYLHRLYAKRNTILPQVGLHCIGVDIGAHICAQLQESFHEPLARISGLNPTVPNGCGGACLDRNDAALVDVIHTTHGGFVGNDRGTIVNLGDLGADQVVGHMDFFVNWNAKVQPACGAKDNSLPQRCSSRRALELFTLSIGETCSFVARSCTQPPAVDPKCIPCTALFQQCVRMGYSANKTQLLDLNVNKFGGVFFVDTLETSPYCGIDD